MDDMREMLKEMADHSITGPKLVGIMFPEAKAAEVAAMASEYGLSIEPYIPGYWHVLPQDNVSAMLLHGENN